MAFTTKLKQKDETRSRSKNLKWKHRIGTNCIFLHLLSLNLPRGCDSIRGRAKKRVAITLIAPLHWLQRISYIFQLAFARPRLISAFCECLPHQSRYPVDSGRCWSSEADIPFHFSLMVRLGWCFHPDASTWLISAASRIGLLWHCQDAAGFLHIVELPSMHATINRHDWIKIAVCRVGERTRANNLIISFLLHGSRFSLFCFLLQQKALNYLLGLKYVCRYQVKNHQLW